MENKFGKEYHRQYYRKRKQAIFEYLGGRCVVCGTTEHLQIDHINREDKSFNISSRLSVKNNKAELDKCQLLCEHHHREKTAEENSGFEHGTMYAWMKKKCRCEICEPAWSAWNEERNAKRRITDGARGPYNQPADHGTPLCYTRGCRCDLCRAANAAKARERRSK